MSNQRNLSERALKEWGETSQVDMAIEEAGELIVAIQKYFKRYSSTTQQLEQKLKNLATEIADVEIMCDQLRCIIGDQLVNDEKESKLERLERRLTEWERGRAVSIEWGDYS